MRQCHRRQLRRYRHSRVGFTIVEMLTATLVMSFTLMGVYAVLRQVSVTEEHVTRRWADQSSADATASYMAAILERMLILPEHPALIAEAQPDVQGRQVIVTAMTQPGDAASGAIARHRVQWGMGQEQAGQVVVQTRFFAGRKELSLLDEENPLTDSQRWQAVPAQVMAEGLSAFEIQFRSAANLEGPWTSDWKAEEGPFVARVMATVGRYTAERVVEPAVKASLIGEDGG